MKVLILGVNGVAGQAIAAELTAAGHTVTGTGRASARLGGPLRSLGVAFVRSDRFVTSDLDAVLGDGADVIVDCLCYSAEHARQLLERRDAFGSAVVLSGKAVYVDDRGRHANSDAAPDFGGPVPEGQPVLEPDFSGAYQSAVGYGTNKVAAEIVLRESGAPVSILRCSRIHGPHATPPREWFVLRRLLDGRRRIPVDHRGASGNHPTSSVNLARLVSWCAAHPDARVLNAADPEPPLAGRMLLDVAAAAGRDVELVGLDDAAPPDLGWTPWSTWPAFFLDTRAAEQLGYEPVGSYGSVVGETVAALMSLDDAGRTALNQSEFFTGRFDYAADDAALAHHDARL